MAGLAAGHILDVLLGEYIEGDSSARQVELDILNGHLLLQNIAVRGGALQRALGLPLVVMSGVIGRVELRIPWQKLNSEPTRLLLDGLLLLVGPQSEAEWDLEAEEKRGFAKKQAALAARGRTRQTTQKEAPAQPPAKQSFLAKLTAQVLERLQARALPLIPYSSRFCLSLSLHGLCVFPTCSVESWSDAVPPRLFYPCRSCPPQLPCHTL
jgi:hypothetical protein